MTAAARGGRKKRKTSGMPFISFFIERIRPLVPRNRLDYAGDDLETGVRHLNHYWTLDTSVFKSKWLDTKYRLACGPLYHSTPYLSSCPIRRARDEQSPIVRGGGAPFGSTGPRSHPSLCVPYTALGHSGFRGFQQIFLHNRTKRPRGATYQTILTVTGYVPMRSLACILFPPPETIAYAKRPW